MNPSNKYRNKLRREKTTVSSGSNSDIEPIHVYCRFRPVKEDIESSYIKLLSPTVLSMTTPSESKVPRKEIHYKYKHIFTSYSSQKEIFDHVAYPLLEDLLKGKNGLLFTYGVTGSGKTFTLTGEQNNPGIMPRCIDTIFNSIGDYQAPKYVIKSDKMNGFDIQSETDAIQDRLQEVRSLRRTPNPKSNSKRNKADQKIYLNEGVRISVNDCNLYAVFISYVEIYNNTVFDLLDEECGILQSKILREDCRKNMYVNNVVEVEVKSSEEAFNIFNLGQKRKRMGATSLNSDSSRSHSIFNIRLVQLEQTSTKVPEQNLLTVGQLSLVDLAGSERTGRTQNIGIRLREASSINSSLMSLRTCMEILRENQQSKSNNKLVPYRDTRLTLLFKNYFEGDGSVQMIVCINPSKEDFEENLHVMKFAEMSQDVKIVKSETRCYTPARRAVVKTPRVPTSSSSRPRHTNLALPELPCLTFNLEDVEQTGKTIDRVNKVLKMRLAQSKSKEFDKSAKEFRKKLLEIYQENLVSKNELKSTKSALNKMRQKSHTLETKVAEAEATKEGVILKREEAEQEIRRLLGKLSEKDLRINQNALERQKTKQKFHLQTEKMSQELDAKLRRQREHVQAAMNAKEQKLRKVRELLDTDEFVPTISSSNRSDGGDGNIENEPPEPKKMKSGEIVVAASTTPRHRRRSRSVGEEVWLEHNSIKPVALGTVMQPSMKKRKSVTKLSKAGDITNPKQSKYCLLLQEPDGDGEMETCLYKADIVPTCSGGAQVVFNDVEKLTQQDPTQ